MNPEHMQHQNDIRERAIETIRDGTIQSAYVGYHDADGTFDSVILTPDNRTAGVECLSHATGALTAVVYPRHHARTAGASKFHTGGVSDERRLSDDIRGDTHDRLGGNVSTMDVYSLEFSDRPVYEAQSVTSVERIARNASVDAPTP